MELDKWAQRWNISEIAIEELRKTLGIAHKGIKTDMDLSESGIQSRVRLEASRKGARLFRNNVGAAQMPDGSFIRFGLANESANVNRQIKSADLIGIRPVKITANMVGFTIGQFISREIKKSNWQYTGDLREVAQLRWAELIMSLGGDACFATEEGTL